MRVAKRDWKKAVQGALDALGDRFRDALDALDELLAPRPDLVPVPVPARDPRDDRARR